MVDPTPPAGVPGKVVDKVTDSLQKLAIGAAKTTAQLGMTNPTITQTVKNFGGVGSVVGAVTEQIEKQVDSYQKLTKSGANFGGSLSGMLIASTRAGLSIKSMSEAVASNSELLAGFGGTVQGGATKFLASMAQMRVSSNTYGRQLRNIGLTHEEIGEAMMQTARMDMMSGRREEASAADIQERTAAYAKDLDLLSKLTGKSNDALKKEQAGLQRQGDFRAKTMGMEANMQKAMLKSSSAANSMGIGDLFKDMMIKGFPSGDQAQLAGMFTNSMGVMKKMKAAQDSGNVEEYKKLEKQLAAATIKDKSANKELAMLGGLNSATAAVSEAYAKTSEAQIAVQAMVEKGTIQEHQIQGELNRRRAAAIAEQEKQGGNVKPGDKVGTDRAMLDSALKSQEAITTAAIKVQEAVTEKLYTQIMGPLFQRMVGAVAGQDAIDSAIDTANKVLSPIAGTFDKKDGMPNKNTVQETDTNLSAAVIAETDPSKRAD